MKKKLKPGVLAAAVAGAVIIAAIPVCIHMSGHADAEKSSISYKSADKSGKKTSGKGKAATPGVVSGKKSKENPPAKPPEGEGGTPPSGAPDGQMGTPPSGAPGGQNGGTPPSGAPDGQMGTPPSGAPGGQNGGTPPSGAPGGQNGTPPGGKSGADTQKSDYSGKYSGKLTASKTKKTAKNKTYKSAKTDENVLLAEKGGTLNAKNLKLKKSGDDTNGDNCNFYGLNSSVLSTGKGSAIYISDSISSSDSEGSNGYFATDKGKIYANNDKITTTAGGNARGLDATYGGTIIANKMTISTRKEHCAALATDRGGGNISVANSLLKTAGSGSPLIYSTGDIEIDNVKGTSSGSQIAGMEGLNTIYISNSSLKSTSDHTSGSDPIKNGVILYQSTSGDADTSTGKQASFTAVNSAFKSSITDGAFFYVTNTSANVVLKNTSLKYSNSVDLINATGNSNNWGTEGKNGGNLTFTGIGEKLHGNIKVDTISTADIYLLKGTVYKGAVSIEKNSKSDSESTSPVTINVDGSSKWIVTADSTVTDLNVARGGKIVDKSGKTVTIMTGSGKILSRGTGSLKVTVKGSYSKKVKTTGKNKVSGPNINRKKFDSHFSVNTKFGKNKGKAGADNLS